MLGPQRGVQSAGHAEPRLHQLRFVRASPFGGERMPTFGRRLVQRVQQRGDFGNLSRSRSNWRNGHRSVTQLGHVEKRRWFNEIGHWPPRPRSVVTQVGHGAPVSDGSENDRTGWRNNAYANVVHKRGVGKAIAFSSAVSSRCLRESKRSIATLTTGDSHSRFASTLSGTIDAGGITGRSRPGSQLPAWKCRKGLCASCRM